MFEQEKEQLRQWAFIMDSLLLYVHRVDTMFTISNLILSFLTIILGLSAAASQVVALKWIAMGAATLSTLSYLLSLYMKNPDKRQHYICLRTDFRMLMQRMTATRENDTTAYCKELQDSYDRLINLYVDVPMTIVRQFQEVYKTFQLTVGILDDGRKTIRIKPKEEVK